MILDELYAKCQTLNKTIFKELIYLYKPVNGNTYMKNVSLDGRYYKYQKPKV